MIRANKKETDSGYQVSRTNNSNHGINKNYTT